MGRIADIQKKKVSFEFQPHIAKIGCLKVADDCPFGILKISLFLWLWYNLQVDLLKRLCDGINAIDEVCNFS